MSTRLRVREDTGRPAGAESGGGGGYEHITRLLGDARELLEAAGPVVGRAVSSDSEAFLSRQTQQGGQ